MAQDELAFDQPMPSMPQASQFPGYQQEPEVGDGDAGPGGQYPYGPARVSHKHDAILTYILANPQEKLQDVAARFRVSQPWLSCIIHSDVFQSKLRERQDLIFHHTLMPLQEKITHLAHRSLDHLTARVESGGMSDTELRKTSDQMMQALGFGSKQAPQQPAAGGVTINNYVGVERDVLAEARNRIEERGRQRSAALIEGEQVNETASAGAPKGLPASGECGMGSHSADPSIRPQETPAQGSEG